MVGIVTTINPPRPPGGYGADDLARSKLALNDIIPILMGAMPVTPETPTPGIDITPFTPTPIGVRRVVVCGYAVSTGAGSCVVWHITKPNGQQAYVDGPQTNDVAIPTGASIRPIALSEGDILTAEDIGGSGGTVIASIGYVDVEAR